MKRREFLRTTAGGLAAGLVGASSSRAAAPARTGDGPKVVLIRFGGGVRPRETIHPGAGNETPLLLQRLLPEGTLLENVRMEGYTTHSVGTMNLTTGRYAFPELPSLDDRFTPPDPTFLELARRELGLHMHEVMVVNNGDFTEWVSFSDAGLEHRPGTLSLPQLKRALARRVLASDPEERAEREARTVLADLDRECYRGVIPLADDAMERFLTEVAALEYRGWQQYRCTDALVFELARAALEQLRPRVLMVNFLDVDYAHWGLDYFYTRGLRRMDHYTWSLYRTVKRLPFYRDDTLFLVVPDCGRGRSPRALMPAQHHQPTEPGADEIFAFAAGPRIPAGRRLEAPFQQADIAPTVGALLGFRSDAWEGRAIEAFLG